MSGESFERGYILIVLIIKTIMYRVCVAVGASNPSAPGGPAFVYPQSIVFASSASNMPTDGYLLSLPSTSAFAISSDGLPSQGSLSAVCLAYGAEDRDELKHVFNSCNKTRKTAWHFDIYPV